MSLMTVAFAGIAGFGVGVGDALVSVPEPLDEVELELELVSCGAPPHPARINANKQRPKPCKRIIRPPGTKQRKGIFIAGEVSSNPVKTSEGLGKWPEGGVRSDRLRSDNPLMELVQWTATAMQGCL